MWEPRDDAGASDAETLAARAARGAGVVEGARVWRARSPR